MQAQAAVETRVQRFDKDIDRAGKNSIQAQAAVVTQNSFLIFSEMARRKNSIQAQAAVVTAVPIRSRRQSRFS